MCNCAIISNWFYCRLADSIFYRTNWDWTIAMIQLLFLIGVSVILQTIIGDEDFSIFVKLVVFLWLIQFITHNLKYIGSIFLIG